MTTKPTNLRFLLSLGNTKMVILQDETDLHIYTNQPATKVHKKGAIAAEHVTEALVSK